MVTGDWAAQLNRNTVKGTELILGLIGDLPSGTPVAFEGAFGWAWLIQLLENYGFDPHLVHPLWCKAIASPWPKNDKADATTLAQLLRANLLLEARIAPQPVRQLRALLRHRTRLVRQGTQPQDRIHAVADFGYDRTGSSTEASIGDPGTAALLHRSMLSGPLVSPVASHRGAMKVQAHLPKLRRAFVATSQYGLVDSTTYHFEICNESAVGLYCD